MLASIVALALAIRAVLGSARPPSPRRATAHLAWLARGDVSEQMRSATSISVGYMSENHADLAFPGMLAFKYAIAANGVEISLPKLVAATVMTFIVYALLIKSVFPIALRWLDARAAAARHQEMRRHQARAAAHHPLLK
jgi:hypothetical protein